MLFLNRSWIKMDKLKNILKEFSGFILAFVSPAYYDVKTDKIVNAKEGTYEWWHERGHQELHHQEVWKNIYAFSQVMITVGVLYLMILSDNINIKYGGMIVLLVVLVDEVHAWLYSLKWKGRGRDNGNLYGMFNRYSLD